MRTDLIDAFAQTYKPTIVTGKPDEELLRFAEEMLPPEIVYLWQSYGFGDYGNGILKVVDPRDYMENLYDWLGKVDYSRIPLFVTAFGDILYYRKLKDGENDIALLDIHYRSSDVFGYRWETFFECVLSTKEALRRFLREALFREAVEKFGPLKHEEIFYFAPALALGGGESLKFLRKGNGFVHQKVLLQL